MRSARQVAWFILGLSVLFAGAGALWLGALYVASFVELPGMLSRFAKAIVETQDISALKTACLSLANLNEAERISRLRFILGSSGMVILLGLLCAAVSGRLLVVLRRVENSEATSQPSHAPRRAR